jgi:hypothetical protein
VTAGRSANSPSGPSPRHCRACHAGIHFSFGVGSAAGGAGSGAFGFARHFGHAGSGSGSSSVQQHDPGWLPHRPHEAGSGAGFGAGAGAQQQLPDEPHADSHPQAPLPHGTARPVRDCTTGNPNAVVAWASTNTSSTAGRQNRLARRRAVRRGG